MHKDVISDKGDYAEEGSAGRRNEAFMNNHHKQTHMLRSKPNSMSFKKGRRRRRWWTKRWWRRWTTSLFTSERAES